MKKLTFLMALSVLFSIPFLTQGQDLIFLGTGDTLRGKIHRMEKQYFIFQPRNSIDERQVYKQAIKGYQIGHNDPVWTNETLNIPRSQNKIENDIYFQNENQVPGNELIKASRRFYTGIFFLTLSAAAPAVGLMLPKTQDVRSFGYAGIGLAIIGIAFEMDGIYHIAMAGRALNRNKVGISLNRDGLGLKYRF